MWLLTTFGFFSVVQKAGTKTLTVRARVRVDLDRLRDRYLPDLSPTKVTPGNDYRYRASVTHEALAAAMGKIVADITYDNFKSEVERKQGHARETIYAKVWSVLNAGLPPLDVPLVLVVPATPKAAKYGGVVFDDDGRILVREPKNHFDGYVWTFAKGNKDEGVTAQETALREVREETGVEAEIVGPVPGVFGGGTGTVAYFLMRKTAQHELDAEGRAETQRVRWVSEREAEGLIAMTTKAVGRKRDLAVLAAACRAWRALG